MDKLENLSRTALTDRLFELRSAERHLIVEFLQYLGELDRRKLYLELGFPSCFAFCREQLGLSESSSSRRVAAARLLARFPVVGEYLKDGRLGVTTLVALRDVLDEDRLDEVLGRAAGCTETQIKELVAALRPRPAPAPVDTFGLNVPPAPTGTLEPISADQHVLRITVSRDFVDDLDKVRAELSHKLPKGRLEDILHECVRFTLKTRATRRRGRGARHVAAAVRRAVFERDGHGCAFVSEGGRRCNSTWQLELHHVVPFARGGAATADNLAVRCRAHNRYHAEVDFGRDYVAARMGR